MMRMVLCISLIALLFSALAPVTRASEAGVQIIEPGSGQTVNGDSVTVELDVEGLDIVSPAVPFSEAGTRPDVNQSGEGHLHVSLDLAPIVILDDEGPLVFSNVPPGDHVLTVELVNNDHSPFDPPIVDTVVFATDDSTTSSQGSEEGSFSMSLGSLLIVTGLLFVRVVEYFASSR